MTTKSNTEWQVDPWTNAEAAYRQFAITNLQPGQIAEARRFCRRYVAGAELVDVFDALGFES